MSILYANPSRDRFFLVPDGVTLPEGELELSELGGASVRVSLEAVAGYEIPPDEARALGEAHVAALRAVAEEIIEVAKWLAAGRRGEEDPSSLERAAELLSAVGVTMEEVESDPAGTLKRAAERLRSLRPGELSAIARAG